LIETFASSGQDISQLFQTTNPVEFVLRTSLSANNEPHMGKKGLHVAIALSSQTLTTLQGNADSENSNPGLAFPFSTAVPIQWINNSSQLITWQNNALQPIQWAATGFLYQRARIDSRGVFLGISLRGTVSGGSGGANTGFIINGLILEYQEQTMLASKSTA
jgi:hypothetical protein